MAVSPAAPAAPHTVAFTTALAAADLAVDVGVAPAGAGWQGEPGESQFVPYVVLFPSPGSTDGDLGDPNAYLDYETQATVVGVTPAQVERAMDKVKATLVGRQLDVTGRNSYRVQLGEGGRPISRDDSVQPPEYYASALFTLRTGPA
ncbi:hypothetical protein Ssi03_50520 [Sphaerisporangium siamense]|uniref:DUF3168 domain-containing protein n=1 Tax=Sphaerisporangium siamense TaxID=795645 RepID=A0A7W7D921_9ACTN|nr:hypothetical protein [Sphaerisporangium siamense]MBB4702244.1 hypothetical protein [Sphaerisporangium siamense]GII87062.1 hypothetical protein Ssi03_50520 [Sphaerisporangium siamense]